MGFYIIIDTQIIYKSAKRNKYIGRLGPPIRLVLNIAGIIASLRDLTNS
jgi:hypothetical protein